MTDRDPHERTSPAIEERVEKIWKDVLGMPAGLHELTFFDLQGQSISAVRIVARIEDELGVTVDVGLLFEDPDLTTFASAVAAVALREERGAA
ncbi:phosphopantetheine-binding protein [Amycolatopsis sp. NPDC051071]|uniref:phosphopantetheine-binding protein n=1 Tax=Amycolatopsis sp. NPDC051071 TaxID=3154637 RepID=UPI003421C7EF